MHQVSRPTRGILTPAEVAQMLRISRSQAYCLLRRGQIPAIRIGRSVRALEEDVEKFINENRFTST